MATASEAGPITKSKNEKPLLMSTWRARVGLMLMALQQLSGINVIMFYSTDIFNQAGLGASLAQFGAILIAITQVYAWLSRRYEHVLVFKSLSEI